MKTCRDPHTSPLRQILPSLMLMLGMLWGSYPSEAQTPKQTPPRAERHASVEGITEYRLPNGLRALLIPDASRDTITLNLTYLVGSRHEGYGESGMAHLLEHLLFRGTSRMGNVMAELNKRGARFNGTTNFDYTNYYQTVSASDDNLHWMLALEADRMLNSRVSRVDLDAEMTVVRNEFESGENNAGSVLRQRVMAAGYLWHNYGRAIIGARSDIENVPIERLQAFYRHYYQPDNAVLILSGRFDEANAVAAIEKHFGALPRPTRKLQSTYTVEPTQDGERSVVLRRVGDVQTVSSLYHLPPGSHPDYPAIDLAVNILTHTPGGRLHRALVESGLASSAFGFEQQLHDAGHAYFSASVREGKPLEPAREALIKTVEDLAQQAFTREEVDQARQRLLNGIEKLTTDTNAMALVLSGVVAMGDWRLLFLQRDQLRSLDAAQVQRVALQYFKAANRTSGTFIPTASPQRAEIPARPDVEALVRDYRGAAQLEQGETFQPTPQNIEARVIRRRLAGGMQLALLPRKTRGGTVVVDLNLRWGDEASKQGRYAACSAAGAMLMRGTTLRNRKQIADELSRINSTASIGIEGGSIQTLRQHLAASLELAAEILQKPAFPETEFEQYRQAVLSGLESQRSDPSALAGLALARQLSPYPPGHWNHVETLEERLEQWRTLQLSDVRRCWRELVGASHSELTVVGDFDPEQVIALAQKLFNDWKSPLPYARIQSRIAQAAPLERDINTPDKANAVYRAGLSIALRDDHPDFVALLMGNYLLGGHSDSRLTRRIRHKEGLSYSVGSSFSAGSQDARADFGLFAIYAPQNRNKVDAAMREEVQRLLSEPVPTEEFDTARKALLLARQVARNQDSAIASRLNGYLSIDRTMAWDAALEQQIAALTPQQVQAALQRHLRLDQLSIITAGDFRDKGNSSAAR